jgi:RNA polymerase sigma factor (sigma-70 family)
VLFVLTRRGLAPYDVPLPSESHRFLSPSLAVGSFPATRHSVVAGIASPDVHTRRVAFDALVSAYWRPVYKYVRIKWRRDREDAADLTQEFFARAFEKGSLGRFEPARTRFRTFLRLCLDGFVANEIKARGRLKRGGGVSFVPIDFAAAEHELSMHPAAHSTDAAGLVGTDEDDLFRQEWLRGLFSDAVAALRASCEAAGKTTQFAVFQRYDLNDHPDARPTYAQLASELAIPVTQVTNYLAFARRELRRLVLERLRALCATDEEFRLEARELLGSDPTSRPA